MPTLDSDHAECEGVSNGLRSLGFAPMTTLQLTNMYFGTFLKNYWPYCQKIFTVARGHRVYQEVKILGKSDEGIFRGRVWKFFSTPYISLKGGSWDVQILTHIRALTCPYRICATQCMQLTKMYFGIFLKNNCPYGYQIFNVPRGHLGHLHVKILGESEEGIF